MNNVATTIVSEERASERLHQLGRGLIIGIASGMIAGLLAGGVGSRIAMRVSAIMGGEKIAGLMTENGNIVGQITAEGTIGLLIFGGLFPGMIGGGLFVALRNWIPGPTAWRGLTFGLLLLLTFGWLIINDSNADFAELGNPGVNVAMFAMLFVFFGLLVHPIFILIDRRLPCVHQGMSRRWVYTFIGTLILTTALLAVGTAGIGGLAACLIIALYIWWPRLKRRIRIPGVFSKVSGNVSQRILRYSLFLLAGTVGAIPLAVSISQIIR